MLCLRGREKRPVFATVTAFVSASGLGVKTASKIWLKGLLVEVGGGLWGGDMVDNVEPYDIY